MLAYINYLEPSVPTGSNTSFLSTTHRLFISILSLAILSIFIIFVIIAATKIYKYRNSDIIESILVQLALQKEHYDQSKIQIKGNLVVRGTTVQFDKDKIKIFVPTKFFWQITSKIDLLQEVRTRVRSQEFNAFLASNFEEFTFAEPIYKKNKYIIIGIRY